MHKDVSTDLVIHIVTFIMVCTMYTLQIIGPNTLLHPDYLIHYFVFNMRLQKSHHYKETYCLDW